MAAKNKYMFYKNYFNITEDFNILSYLYSEKVIKEINQKDSNQLIYLDKEIFLPIYSLSASGIPYLTDFPTVKINSDFHFNNTFSVNDYLFTSKVLNRNLNNIGGIYYKVEPGNYYYFVDTFKIPFETIKTDYIHNHMPKLFEIMKKNNIDFTDVEYYIFYKDTAFFAQPPIKRQKLKLTNVPN